MKKFYLLLLTAIVSQCAPLFGQIPGSSPRFYGYLRYDAETFTQSGGPTGLYSIDATAEGRVKAVDLSLTAAGGGCFGDGKYYVVDYTQNNYGELTSVTLKTYNPEGWTLISEKEIPQTSIPTTMTYNPVDNRIYGCFFNNETDKMGFGTMNKEDGTTEISKVLDVSITAMACDHNGTIYAISADGNLSRYDSTSGDFVKIGTTGLLPKYIQDATFDYDTKTLYWFAMTESPDEAGIYTVDTESGLATKVTAYATGEKELTGVFSMAPVYAPDVPGLVSNVDVAVNPATMTATIKFDMPSVTYGEQPLSGVLEYEVYVDGVKVGTGEANAGSQAGITANVEVGEHRVSVRAVNASGSGPEYFTIIFAGFDTPAKVANVVAARRSDGIKITWDEVTTGVSGNPIDMANLRYTVTRMPEDVKVATLVAGLEAMDEAAEVDAVKCYYEVVATDGTLASEAGESNEVVYGSALGLPFSYDFRDKPGLGLFSIDDANSDGVLWMFRDKYGILVGNGRTQLDDWLITPPLKLNSGRKYKLTASIGASMGDEKFEVKYGVGNRPEDMTETVIEPTVIDDIDYWYRDVWDEPGNFVVYVSPSESGEYHFGVHGISEPGGLFLYCCDLAFEDAGSSGVEDGLTSTKPITVTTEPGCVIVSGVSGTVSVYSISGQLVAMAEGDARISVAPGVYVVKSCGDVYKVLVR